MDGPPGSEEARPVAAARVRPLRAAAGVRLPQGTLNCGAEPVRRAGLSAVVLLARYCVYLIGQTCLGSPAGRADPGDLGESIRTGFCCN